MKKFFLLFVMAVMMAVTTNAQTYSLTRQSEGLVDCDSIEVLYMRGKSVVINFEGYDRNDIWVDSVATMEYGGNLGNFTAEINTYADSVPFHMCWINVTAFKTGNFAGHVTVHAEARGASGAVLHQDTLVISFVGTIIPRKSTDDPVNCNPIATFPWMETFDNISSGVPACWDNSEGTTSVNDYRWTAYEDNGEKCVRFDSYYNSNGNTNILRTPELVLGDSMMLSMEYKNPEGGNYYVTVISADGGRTVLSESLTDQAEWKTREFDLTPFANQTVRIGFEGTSNYGSGDAYLYLNNVVVKKGIAQRDTTPLIVFDYPDYIMPSMTLGVDTSRVVTIDAYVKNIAFEDLSVDCQDTMTFMISRFFYDDVQSDAYRAHVNVKVRALAAGVHEAYLSIASNDGVVGSTHLKVEVMEPEPEYVEPDYISMPLSTYGYYPEGQIEMATCVLQGGTRNCRVEWGWVENYFDRESQAWGPDYGSDITKQPVYHFLKEDTAYTVESDPTSTAYNPVLVLKSEFNPANYPAVTLNDRFYCRVYQGDNLLNTQVFKYMNAYEMRRIIIYAGDVELPFRAGDTVNNFVRVEVYDGPEAISEQGRLNYYNALDTAATTPVSVFQNGNMYYAQLETPFDSLFASYAVLTENTKIAWYGGAPEWLEQLESTMGFGAPYDMSGRFRSPVFTVDEVTWYATIIKEGDGIMVEAGMVFDHDAVVVDTVRMEISLDGENWMPLSGENIEADGEGISAYFESLSFRAGTYYFRFIGVTNIGTITSKAYTVVIGGGINIDLESVTEGTVEYDAESKTVTISGVVIENVEIALTNMEDGATIALDGTTTITADSTGILTSADVVIEGSYGAEFTSTDTTTIVAAHPIAASAEGVKLVLDGVTLHLVVVHSAAASVPGRDAARRQMSPMMRARYIAHSVLLTQNAEDESVISGFDEVDFINCGIIEPVGAEYNEEDMELMNDGDPVYNCTIVPMETPEPEGIGLMKQEKVASDKRVAGGMVLIIRQEKAYTVTGQLVK